MTIKEAINIMEKHNEWRRDNVFPSSKKMVRPSELGVAIDTIVNYFKKQSQYAIHNTGATPRPKRNNSGK